MLINYIVMNFTGLKLHGILNLLKQFPVEGAKFLSEDSLPTAEEVHSLNQLSLRKKRKKTEKRLLYIISADFFRK